MSNGNCTGYVYIAARSSNNLSIHLGHSILITTTTITATATTAPATVIKLSDSFLHILKVTDTRSKHTCSSIPLITKTPKHVLPSNWRRHHRRRPLRSHTRSRSPPSEHPLRPLRISRGISRHRRRHHALPQRPQDSRRPRRIQEHLPPWPQLREALLPFR